MLTANAKLDVSPRGPAPFRRNPHQFANTLRVDGDERIGFENALGGIFPDEAGRIIAADAESSLGKVIGAEGEEFG